MCVICPGYNSESCQEMVREKSGNFILSQGKKEHFEEKSGNIDIT